MGLVSLKAEVQLYKIRLAGGFRLENWWGGGDRRQVRRGGECGIFNDFQWSPPPQNETLYKLHNYDNSAGIGYMCMSYR